MEINEVIQVVEKRAIEIAEQEILKYNKDYPELNLTDEAKEAVKTRSISQLTLQLSKFHFRNDQELEEQFSKWFSENEEDDLRKSCRHCLDEVANKIRNASAKNLSSLDAYLKKHLGNAHTIE
jgi:arginine utilization protein RocB